MKTGTTPEIVTNYRDYTPTVDLAPTVRMLLRYVPDGCLGGLRYIELTNSTSTRQLRRGKTWWRGKKVPMARCWGFYYGDHIRILVDNLLNEVPWWHMHVPFVRASWVGVVLYNEIGHHIHAKQAPAFNEPEAVADAWRDRLMGIFLRRRYWYTMPAMKAAAHLLRGYQRRRQVRKAPPAAA